MKQCVFEKAEKSASQLARAKGFFSKVAHSSESEESEHDPESQADRDFLNDAEDLEDISFYRFKFK